MCRVLILLACLVTSEVGVAETNDLWLGLGGQLAADRASSNGAKARFTRLARPSISMRAELRAVARETEMASLEGWDESPKAAHRGTERRLLALVQEPTPERGRPGVSYEETFRDLYETLGRSYPNFELKSINWVDVGRELLPRANQVATDEEFGQLCYKLVARLEDSHAFVGRGLIDPPAVEFARWDAGFACMIDDRGKPVIYHVENASPAAEQGVRVGMTVVSINGRLAADLIEETMNTVRRFAGFSSERYLKYQAARWFPRQLARNAPVPLVTQDHDGERHMFELTAAMSTRYLPRLPVPNPGIEDAESVSWKMLNGNIGLIYVRRIRSDLIPKLNQAVAELRNAAGLIVDVRGNSGGGFDFNRSHINFVAGGGREHERPRFTGPMALLIDSRCISAGEGWASWFVANDRARVFGMTTAGASGRKTTYTLKNGLFKVTFPVKAYKGYLDRPIERRGLTPDVEVTQTAADLAAGRDTVLEAARTYLLESGH